MNSNQYSYSRCTTYMKCPRQHYYRYIESIPIKDSANTIPGSMFHKCCELYLKHKEEEIPNIYTEFDTLCNLGTLQLEAGLLKYLFELYLSYYKNEFEEETNIAVELPFNEILNPEDPEESQDVFKGIIDEILKTKGLIVIRDRKTALSKLKYNYDNVKYNQQLLVYVPYAEDIIGLRADAIEIDEILFHKLEPVPLLKNGKPSKDKEKLKYVTYDAYYNKLCEMCIEDEKEYEGIKEYLAKRGHPLFNRVRVQLLDDNIISSNAQDILDLYKTIKNNFDNKYRLRGPLCEWCPYKELCNLDMEHPDEDIRNSVIEKLNI